MKDAVLIIEPKGTMLEVVRSAKSRGFAVIALMTDPAALELLPTPYDSAKHCIDTVLHIKDWQNAEEVLETVSGIKKERQIAGVYFGTDACAAIGSVLRTQLGLPSTKPHSMANILNKRKMRLRLNECGLSNIRSYSKEESEALKAWPFEEAAYFKPLYGSFSLFVKRCEGLSDLALAQNQWKSEHNISMKYMSDYMGQSDEYHLEEAFDGELMSVEAITQNGVVQVLGLTSRILYSKDSSVEIGSCFPYPHPLSDKIIDAVKRAHAALDFTDGPSHTEVIVNSKGKVEIIDFNPRFVGADVLQSINFAYGIKIEEALLDWTLGRKVSISPSAQLFSCLQYVLASQPIKFESISFPLTSEVKFSTSFLKPGTVLKDVHRQIDYVGTYLTVMESFEKAVRRSRELRNQVRINHTLEGAY